MSSQPPKSIGDQELALLRFVSDAGRSTVAQAVEGFGQPRGLARSTVLTMMERLRKKGHLGRRRVDGVYHYAPRTAPGAALQHAVRTFVDRSERIRRPRGASRAAGNRAGECAGGGLVALSPRLDGPGPRHAVYDCGARTRSRRGARCASTCTAFLAASLCHGRSARCVDHGIGRGGDGKCFRVAGHWRPVHRIPRQARLHGAHGLSDVWVDGCRDAESRRGRCRSCPR